MAEASESARPFGAYDILGELGRGGMGVVWRARHRSLQRECALKTLGVHLGSEDAVRSFVKEAQAVARLGKHAHIVQVFDAGVVDGTPFIAMELVRGGSLDDQVRKSGGLEERALLEIGRKVALALDHAHRRGIVHRDVKPANIMIDETGEPLVLDFGIAKDLSESVGPSVEERLAGTPAYMSPEQADPQRGPVDARTDVYCLGATLFAAATGRAPFQGKTLEDLLLKVLLEPAERPSEHAGVSPDADAIILKALDKFPRRRYQTALELADDLSRVLSGRPSKAREVGLAGRLLRRARSLGPIAAVVLAFAGFAVVASAFFALRALEEDALRKTLSREIARGAAIEARAFVAPAGPALDELSLSHDMGLLPLDDRERLSRHLAVRLLASDRFQWVSWSDARGRFTGAFRAADGRAAVNLSWIEPDGTGRLREHVLDAARTPLRSRDDWSYDPRRRPFFERASAATGVAWTDPYEWFDGEGVGITAARALREEGRVLGVFTTDLRMTAVSRWLRGLKVGARGRAFLLDRAGALIASQDEKASRDALLDAAVKAAPRPLAGMREGDHEEWTFAHDGADHVAAVEFFRAAPGLSWAVATIVPEDDATEDVRREAAATARLAGIALALLLALVALVGARRRAALAADLHRREAARDERRRSAGTANVPRAPSPPPAAPDGDHASTI